MNKEEITEIVSMLTDQWRPYHFGSCKIISLRDKCTCHLCLINKLKNAALLNNKPEDTD